MFTRNKEGGKPMNRNPRRTQHHLTALLLLSLILSSCVAFTNSGAKSEESEIPRNVIVMIADGCGFNHVFAADLYQRGKANTQVYERFPVKLAMSTFPDGGEYSPSKAKKDPKYLDIAPTDSAAAATAMATGVKTYNAAIGVDKSKKPVPNILERAEALGKSTGVVTTVPISHATPASFAAHNSSRNNYEQIGRQMIRRSALEVIMGCGNPAFNDSAKPTTGPLDYKYVGGKRTWDGLLQGKAGADADGDGLPDPWTLIQTREQFQKLDTGPAPKRLLGVAQAATTLQAYRKGDAKAAPYAVPPNPNVPTLAEMTRAALNVLDDNPKGLCLMIEGGAVDWAAHSHESGRMIEEELDFDKAVEAVVDWVGKNGNWKDTLVVVTADHETGRLTGKNPRKPGLKSSPEGKIPEMLWNSGGHTNSLVPFFAKGAGAERFVQRATGKDPVRGRYIDNTDIANVVFSLMQD